MAMTGGTAKLVHTGKNVDYNGVLYESLVDGNVWEPNVAGFESLWKEYEG